MTDPAPSPPETTIVGNLDMADERDRGLLRRAAGDASRKRWNVTDTDKADFIKALRVALRMSLEAKDGRGVRGCVDTLARLEGQNQADEHLADKNARLDAGQATENVQQAVRIIIE